MEETSMNTEITATGAQAIPTVGYTEQDERELATRPIEVITAEIVAYKQQAGYACIEIGRRLIEAKEQLTHGEWLPWLAEKVEFSEVSAQRFMRLAREYTNPSLVTDLGPSKALSLLALPASEREEFVAEKHQINGVEKTAAEMSKRELEQAIRERDEARRQVAELKADIETQLEEQRTVYDTDMADAEGRLEEAKAAKERADQQIAALKAEMARLKEAQQTVAVEQVPDPEAVAAAVAAEQKKTAAKIERAQKEMEKAQKAADKAEKAKAEAERELAAAKVAQEQAAALAEQEKKTMAEQVQTLQKKLAVASSSDINVFKLYFEAVKENIGKMTECIARMEEAGAGAEAGRLKNALAALLDASKEAVA